MRETLRRQVEVTMDGRTKRRITAMRRVQAAALALFKQRGFDAVTIEEIAEAAESSPATVYRNFGSKEQVILWDEYDPLLLEAFADRLGKQVPLDAIEAGLSATLGEVYARDRDRILRRAKLISAHPALLAATMPGNAALRQALAELLVKKRVSPDRLSAEVLAGAVVATLEVAVGEWVRLDGKQPLGRVLAKAFTRLRALDA